MKNLAEELKAVVKEVQWYKYWGKKKELENMNKEKNDKKKGVTGILPTNVTAGLPIGYKLIIIKNKIT